MNNHAFYIDESKVLSKDDFICAYNESYFIGGKRLVKGTGQNSKIAENEMERLLKEGIKTNLDVMNILAWKLGKIKHNDSDKAGKIIYYKGWDKIETCCVKRYNDILDLNEGGKLL